MADSLICYITCSGNAGGTAIADFISGKQSYFDTNAPNTTMIETMMIFGPNGMWPTFQWFFDQLSAGQDVEILVGYYDDMGVRKGGHYLTVNGVAFGIPFGLGMGTMGVIDPAGGVNKTLNLSTTTVGGAALYSSTYANGFNTFIEAGVAESPIPEPSTMYLLLVGTAITILIRRRI